MFSDWKTEMQHHFHTTRLDDGGIDLRYDLNFKFPDHKNACKCPCLSDYRQYANIASWGIPFWELTYPIPRHFWVDDFPFLKVGYVIVPWSDAPFKGMSIDMTCILVIWKSPKFRSLHAGWLATIFSFPSVRVDLWEAPWARLEWCVSFVSPGRARNLRFFFSTWTPRAPNTIFRRYD